MYLTSGAIFRSVEAVRIAQENRAQRHAICITMSRVNKIRHITPKKMRASLHDARSVTCMPRFYAWRRGF
ncbi:MAG: hypothetical protein ACKO54_11255, partial [Alphaproteobacteria bacterium]